MGDEQLPVHTRPWMQRLAVGVQAIYAASSSENRHTVMIGGVSGVSVSGGTDYEENKAKTLHPSRTVPAFLLGKYNVAKADDGFYRVMPDTVSVEKTNTGTPNRYKVTLFVTDITYIHFQHVDEKRPCQTSVQAEERAASTTRLCPLTVKPDPKSKIPKPARLVALCSWSIDCHQLSVLDDVRVIFVFTYQDQCVLSTAQRARATRQSVASFQSFEACRQIVKGIRGIGSVVHRDSAGCRAQAASFTGAAGFDVHAAVRRRRR